MGSWYPPFAKNAKDGLPPVLVVPAKSRAWAIRLFRIFCNVGDGWTTIEWKPGGTEAP